MGTGFDARMLAALVMVTRTQGEIEGFDAAAEWVGMPDYEKPPKVFEVVVTCSTEKERAKFLAKMGIKKQRQYSSGIISVRWPLRDNDDLKSLRFEADPTKKNEAVAA